jgi:hypothetical protein
VNFGNTLERPCGDQSEMRHRSSLGRLKITPGSGAPALTLRHQPPQRSVVNMLPGTKPAASDVTWALPGAFRARAAKPASSSVYPTSAATRPGTEH